MAGGGRLRCASRAWGCLSRSCLPPLLPLRRWAKITWPSAGFLLLLLRFPILQPKWRRAPEGLERTQGETQSCRLKLQRTARSGVARCFSRAVLVLRRPCNWKLESGLKEEGDSKEPSSLLTVSHGFVCTAFVPEYRYHSLMHDGTRYRCWCFDVNHIPGRSVDWQAAEHTLSTSATTVYYHAMWLSKRRALHSIFVHERKQWSMPARV